MACTRARSARHPLGFLFTQLEDFVRARAVMRGGLLVSPGRFRARSRVECCPRRRGLSSSATSRVLNPAHLSCRRMSSLLGQEPAIEKIDSRVWTSTRLRSCMRLCGVADAVTPRRRGAQARARRRRCSFAYVALAYIRTSGQVVWLRATSIIFEPPWTEELEGARAFYLRGRLGLVASRNLRFYLWHHSPRCKVRAGSG